jgi:hypothetical protein
MSTTQQSDQMSSATVADRHRGALATGVWAVLAAAMVAFGLAPLAVPSSYVWTEHGISESGAQGIDGAWVTRLGFILFGLAVLLLVRVRAKEWRPLGTMFHLAFGVSMFGVAAFSTKPWEANAPYVDSEDFLHDIFASTLGFSFIAGAVTVMIVRRNRTVRGALPDLAAIAITSAVPLTISTSIWGLLQRAMFLTAALWYGREAWLSGAGWQRRALYGSTNQWRRSPNRQNRRHQRSTH